MVKTTALPAGLPAPRFGRPLLPGLRFLAWPSRHASTDRRGAPLATAAAALVAGLLQAAAPGPASAELLPAAGAAGPAALCEDWAAVAAVEHGVPARLMLAIARVETGRQTDAGLRAWPWAVNVEGGGHWFATRQEALDYAGSRLAQGAGQVDIGCFQLNVGWHARAFSGLDQMIDPARNARYAARFLAALHGEFGDWTRAAAAYHSRTPETGRAYVARLAAMLDTFPAADGKPAPIAAPQPLAALSPAPALPPRFGSLMPLTGVVARPIVPEPAR